MATLLSSVLLALPRTRWHSAYGGLALNLESVGVCFTKATVLLGAVV